MTQIILRYGVQNRVKAVINNIVRDISQFKSFNYGKREIINVILLKYKSS